MDAVTRSRPESEANEKVPETYISSKDQQRATHWMQTWLPTSLLQHSMKFI